MGTHVSCYLIGNLLSTDIVFDVIKNEFTIFSNVVYTLSVSRAARPLQGSILAKIHATLITFAKQTRYLHIYKCNLQFFDKIARSHNTSFLVVSDIFV